MVERLMDGTIRLKSGKIMYGNSIPMLEDWPELLEVFTGVQKMPPKSSGFPPLVESIFRSPDGRVYSFKLESEKEYAEVGVAGVSLSIGCEAVKDRVEVGRARKMLGILDPESAAALWLEACIKAMLSTWPRRKKGK